MTSDEKASLANERRKNGRAKPWQLKYLGIGNEIWGCGGNMRGEYAADINRRFSYFPRHQHCRAVARRSAFDVVDRSAAPESGGLSSTRGASRNN